VLPNITGGIAADIARLVTDGYPIPIGITAPCCVLAKCRATMITMATVSYLDRFLDPVTEAFTPELARKIVELRADAELQSHVAVLRRKANEGTLTPDEEAEYKDFVEALDVVSIIQGKARQFLAGYQQD
jgi:hypothetical protein